MKVEKIIKLFSNEESVTGVDMDVALMKEIWSDALLILVLEVSMNKEHMITYILK